MLAGNPAENLPALGDWSGPIYGELGVLESDGERVRCHICGRMYLFLGNHVVRAHSVSADEYRAIFGLNRGTGLAGPAYQAQARQWAMDHFRAYWPQAAERARNWTPDIRNKPSSRTRRLETKIDPHNREMQR